MSADSPRAPRDRPWPASWTALAGRDAYLAENGFTIAEYEAPHVHIPVLGYRMPFPNPPSRKRAVRLHDLHHVATGYGTDHVGEGEISAWELRRGLRPLGLLVAAIVLSGALLGFMIAPRRTLRAYKASSSAPSLFHGLIPYETLLAMSVAELRATLGVPPEGLAHEPRALHALAPREA
jgi:hypothetical protein